ncbi:high-affinity nitrate transporter-activating protein 2.1-like protein [Carex littledalei]|uniref:High-affinity nitrate transporter n=1 Tax=Carex littledalei TaxID=544730 RepID=A0A833VFP7_9POAL|nr:high-affinity nitrate transporter-activating protein 2.1-like protein [Carex littledalei]
MAGMGSSKTTIALLFLIVCSVGPSAAVLLSQLPKTLIVTASAKEGEVLHAGKDKITVTWALNESLGASTADSYKTVKVQLCYAPISQKDRKWRKTNDLLKKDKTCQFDVIKTAYPGSGKHEYLVDREVPSASYFVRAYVLDASNTQVAFGQTTDKDKMTNIFTIVGISGRTVGIEISAGVFSAFSVAALIFFYVVETRKKNN